jgi:predicted Zn-dependent protease with MMP-like domain
MDITEEKFNQLVEEALDRLPEKYLARMNNVAIISADFPTKEQLDGAGRKERWSLLGLYEGRVQSSRIYMGPVLPDRITLFRYPIMKSCDSLEECRDRIESTLRHEIAHHFGSDEKGARKAGIIKP